MTSTDCGRATCHRTEADHIECLDKWMAEDRKRKQRQDDLAAFWEVRLEAIPDTFTIQKRQRDRAMTPDEERDLGYDDLGDCFTGKGIHAWGYEPESEPWRD